MEKKIAYWKTVACWQVIISTSAGKPPIKSQDRLAVLKFGKQKHYILYILIDGESPQVAKFCKASVFKNNVP